MIFSYIISRLSEICIKLHISYGVGPHVYRDNRGYGAAGPIDVGEENNILYPDCEFRVVGEIGMMGGGAVADGGGGFALPKGGKVR